jgi:hypothetical protein
MLVHRETGSFHLNICVNMHALRIFLTKIFNLFINQMNARMR